jgi:hypothetical protein
MLFLYRGEQRKAACLAQQCTGTSQHVGGECNISYLHSMVWQQAGPIGDSVATMQRGFHSSYCIMYVGIKAERHVVS